MIFFLIILLVVSTSGSSQTVSLTECITNNQNIKEQVSPCFDDFIPIEPPDVIIDPQPDSPYPTSIPLETSIK